MSHFYFALAQKTWLETRGRFAAGSALVTAITTSAILRAPSTIAAHEQARHMHFGYGEYLWASLHGGYLQAIWVCSALLLAMGGLLREYAQGSSSFTLSLPVSRRSAFIIRSLVALLEIVALGVVSAFLIAYLSPLAGYSFPLSEALRYSACLTGGGLVFFAWGLLLSHLLQGDYSAPTVAIVSVAVLYIVLKIPLFKPYNIFNLMSGAGLLDDRTYFFENGLPWRNLGLCAVLALGLSGVAELIMEKRDL